MSWILYDKPIEEVNLRLFLEEITCGRPLLFSRIGEVDWSLKKTNEILAEYGSNDVPGEVSRQDGLRFRLELHDGLKVEDLATIEAIALAMSARFECRTCCDASRVQLKDSPYYSLLFDRGRVFFADDSSLEETGDVVKLVEMAYSPSPIDLSVFW